MANGDVQWLGQVARAWAALRQLQLGTGASVILDCSAVPPKACRGALAAITAAHHLATDLRLSKLVQSREPVGSPPALDTRSVCAGLGGVAPGDCRRCSMAATTFHRVSGAIRRYA